MKKSKLRRVWVYKKTRTTMDKLKIGDIFSVDPLNPKDKEADSKQLFRAITKPVPQVGMPKGHYELRGKELLEKVYD